MMEPIDICAAIADALGTEALPFGALPLPPGLEPPFVAIRRTGGMRANVVLDAHEVEFGVYASDWAKADAVAARALGMVDGLAGTMLGGVQCYVAEVTTLPFPDPDPENEALPRVTFGFELITRAMEA